MGFQDFMAKVRYWDNYYARWMMRHFYIIFFEFVLVIIFFLWFFQTIQSIDLNLHLSRDSNVEQLLQHQVTNTQIIVVLLLLNSFWMLYIFNGINRLRFILKEISYNLMRGRHKKSKNNDSSW